MKHQRIVALLMAVALCACPLGLSALADEAPVKWSGTISCAPYMGAPPETDEVTPYLVERLKEYGYDIEYELVYLESAQYSQLMNMRLASGDAPDVFYSGSMATQAEYYAQGVIASWEESFFREAAPNVSRIFDEGGPNGMTKGHEARTWALTKASDGRMITVPIIYFAQNIQNDIMYNGLWIERLGMTEMPRDLDEFEALMRRFVAEDPDGNGQDDTYGFSQSMFNVVYGAYGGIPTQWKLMDDGTIVYGAVLPGMRDALEKLAYYYAEGLIDPEFITGENAGGHWSISHAIANGYIGVTHLAGYHHFMTAEEKEMLTGIPGNESNNAAEIRKVQGPDAHFVTGPALIGPSGDVGVKQNAPASSVNTLYNAQMDEAKLAACLGIMDVFAQDTDLALSARFGIPERDWNYTQEADGTVSATFLYGIPQAGNFGGSAMRNLYGPGDVYNDEYYRIVAMKNAEICGVEWVRAMGENRAVGYVDPVFVALDSISTYKADLDTMQSELFNKIIRGEADISEYDAFVTQWHALGGQKMTDEVNAWYQSIR